MKRSSVEWLQKPEEHLPFPRASEEYLYFQHCLTLERVFAEAIEDQSQELAPNGRFPQEQNW